MSNSTYHSCLCACRRTALVGRQGYLLMNMIQSSSHTSLDLFEICDVAVLFRVMLVKTGARSANPVTPI
jgi:hypothetical protein